MRTITLRRVVITGMGVVTDIGEDVPTMWDSMLQGRSGIGPITAFEQDDRWTVRFAGEASEWDPTKWIDHKELKRIDRFAALGICAAGEAAKDCGIDFSEGDPYRRGVVIGSGVGGIITIEQGHKRLIDGGPRKISPLPVPKLKDNA